MVFPLVLTKYISITMLNSIFWLDGMLDCMTLDILYSVYVYSILCLYIRILERMKSTGAYDIHTEKKNQILHFLSLPLQSTFCLEISGSFFCCLCACKRAFPYVTYVLKKSCATYMLYYVTNLRHVMGVTSILRVTHFVLKKYTTFSLQGKGQVTPCYLKKNCHCLTELK